MSFDERVRELAAEAERNKGAFSWTTERDTYLNHLQRLHGSVESWFAGLVAGKHLILRHESIRLEEEEIGAYEAPVLVLVIGRREVGLVPAGTRFLGAQGIVDIVNGREHTPVATVLLQKEGAVLQWRLRNPREPVLRSFDRSSFTKVLEPLLN